MKLLFDLLPVLVFFVAFKRFDIYVATAAAILTTVGQVGWLKLRGRPVPAPMWLSLGVIVVFGGATILLQDERFVKLKPTILYWAMAVALLFGRVVLGRDFLRSLAGERLKMSETGWTLMNRMWISFFLLLGAANLYVARFYPTDTWVTFKAVWCTGLLLVFAVAQGLVLSKHIREEDADLQSR